MPNQPQSRPGTRLGTQLRGRLTAAYQRRGKSQGDLVLHYSFKSRTDVALSAELQLLHFLHAETDPDVLMVNYQPAKEVAHLVGAQYVDLIHAAVTLKDGSCVWRRLVAEPTNNDKLADLNSRINAASLPGEVSRLETMTRDQLAANLVRLRNALRGIAWIAAAKHWPLVDQKKQVLALIRQRPATFESILGLAEGPQRALFGAAVLELAFAGSVKHDLFELPLTAISNFRANGP